MSFPLKIRLPQSGPEPHIKNSHVWGNRERLQLAFFSTYPLQTILCALWGFPAYFFVILLLLPASVFSFIFCPLCFHQYCAHLSSPPSPSSFSYMSSPLFSSRTMRVSCRPCRNKLRPAPLLPRQRKRKKKRKKVKSRDGNFPLYNLLDLSYQINPLSVIKAGFDHRWSYHLLIFYRANLKVILKILNSIDCALCPGSGAECVPWDTRFLSLVFTEISWAVYIYVSYYYIYEGYVYVADKLTLKTLCTKFFIF